MGAPITGKYLAIYLTPASRRAILKEFPPVHPVVYADHVTVSYEPTPEEVESSPLGSIVKFRVTGYADDGKAQAVRVDLPPDVSVPSGRLPHVTISTAQGVAPEQSKTTIRKARSVSGGQYSGIFDFSSRKHKVRTPFFPLAADRVVLGHLKRVSQRPKFQTLYVFDFDGTLFRSPHPPDGHGEEWWDDIKSLSPPIVPRSPSGSWWNPGPVQAMKRAVADPSGYTVAMSGRGPWFRRRISELLKGAGLSPDETILKSSGDVSSYKRAEVLYLLKMFPTIREVVVYEDNAQTLATIGKAVGRLGILFSPTHVSKRSVKVASTPDGLARKYIRSGLMSGP